MQECALPRGSGTGGSGQQQQQQQQQQQGLWGASRRSLSLPWLLLAGWPAVRPAA
jgi:hypothetical protein